MLELTWELLLLLVSSRIALTLPSAPPGVKRSFINSYAGPFSVSLEDVQHCMDDNNDARTLDVTWEGKLQYNSTVKKRLAKTTVVWHRDIRHSDHTSFLKLAKWDSVAGWRDNFFIMKLGDFCRLIETSGTAFWKIGVTGYAPPLSEKCPIRKGTFRTVPEGISMDFSNISDYPVAPYGRYRGEYRHTDTATGEVKLCVIIIGKVHPRI